MCWNITCLDVVISWSLARKPLKVIRPLYEVYSLISREAFLHQRSYNGDMVGKILHQECWNDEKHVPSFF